MLRALLATLLKLPFKPHHINLQILTQKCNKPCPYLRNSLQHPLSACTRQQSKQREVGSCHPPLWRTHPKANISKLNHRDCPPPPALVHGNLLSCPGGVSVCWSTVFLLLCLFHPGIRGSGGISWSPWTSCGFHPHSRRGAAGGGGSHPCVCWT